MDNVAFENNTLELVIKDGAQLDIQDINIIAGSKDGVELSLVDGRWRRSMHGWRGDCKYGRINYNDGRYEDR